MRIKDAYITTSNFYSKNDDLFNKKVRSLMKSKKEFNIASLSFGNDKGMISSSSNILTSGVNKKIIIYQYIIAISFFILIKY